MRNRKGFSLIELLAVLVIIGLILLIVIPATSKLLSNNKKTEYHNYLNIVKSAATSYADRKKDELGGSNDTGCLEVSIDELILGNYMKSFNDSKITCSGTTRLNNQKGNLTVTVNMTCTDNEGVETFKIEEIDASSCISYVPLDDETIKAQLIKNGLGKNGSFFTPSSGNDTFISGNNPNNYVWYSGKMWRIVSYSDDSLKLITDDIITVLPKNNTNSNYANSIVDNWLTNTFLPTLKDVDSYLVDTSWDVSLTSSQATYPTGNSVVIRKVGLLNSFEVSSMGDYLDSNNNWLLSNSKSTSTVRTATKGGSDSIQDVTFSSNSYYSIRPSITIDASINTISGNGTYSYPYILEGNSTNIPSNTLLNTRYSGEYLYINHILYRIVKVSGGLTQVIMLDNIDSRIYDNNTDSYTSSDLYTYLNYDWYRNSLGTDKNLIDTGASWCHDPVYETKPYSDNCTVRVTSTVGLPILGDLFTANNRNDSSTFWTMTPYLSSNKTMNVISSNHRSNLSIQSKANVRVVLYLKSNTVITSGNGTKDSPFYLSLKETT